MLVDQTAFLQGVHNAEAEHPTIEKLADAIISATVNISYPGPVGRYVCDYSTLMTALAGIEAPWIHWVLMWKHLGEWLASGITVANPETN